MIDFTINIYKEFSHALSKNNSSFLLFKDYIQTLFDNDKSSIIILRHDVDRLPNNALKMAHLEKSLGIKGTYYFRVVPESYELDIMNQIAELGHEIGYHYEDVDIAASSKKFKGKSTKEKKEGKRKNGSGPKQGVNWNDGIKAKDMGKWKNEISNRGNSKNSETKEGFQNSKIPKDLLIDLAYESFCKNLEMFRKNFDIKTICMHGSPRLKYDNKIIWKKYDYRELGIIGEPYFDIDWNEFAYFTDTGRRWNGNSVSVRDKVESEKYAVLSRQFKSTQQIIDNMDKLPDKVMFTIHPQRWTNDPILWTKELIVQNVKNVMKRVIVSRNQ